MDREDNLKIIDLKVSVNCCEGCKRKVLKALSIKGVLKAEIHPNLPKVTVTGNTHAQILIKKLAKIGKIAQIWPQETLSSSSSSKTIRVDQETLLPKAIEDHKVIIKDCKGNTSSEEVNHQSKKHEGSVGERSSKQAGESDLINSDVIKETDGSTNAGKMTASHIEARDDGGHRKGIDHHGNNYKTCAPPQTARHAPTLVTASIPDQIMNCVGNTILVMPNQQASLDAQIYHQPVEAAYYNAPVIPMTYSTAVNACCYNIDCHCYAPCERSVMYQMPPLHSQEARGITDYFNDDNTAGCTVM